MNSRDLCHIIRDRTGYYRVMSMEYIPQPEFGETSVASEMTYTEASKVAMGLNEVENVMSS